MIQIPVSCSEEKAFDKFNNCDKSNIGEHENLELPQTVTSNVPYACCRPEHS